MTVGVSLTSQAVLAALKPLFALRGAPRFVRSDNGPEFIASEIKAWLQESGSAPHYIDPDYIDPDYIDPDYIDPGCPWQNGFQESFHGKVRDDLLNRELFVSVAQAKICLEAHRHWYNEERPHSSLKYLSPLKFAESWKQSQTSQNQEAIEPPE